MGAERGIDVQRGTWDVDMQRRRERCRKAVSDYGRLRACSEREFSNDRHVPEDLVRTSYIELHGGELD